MEQKGFWNWAEGTKIELVDPMVEEVWGGSLLLCDVQKRETEKGLQAQAPACLSMLQNVGRAKDLDFGIQSKCFFLLHGQI